MNECTVRGVVLDRANNVIAHARVRLYRVPPLPKGQPDGPIKRIDPPYIECASGEDGSFALCDKWRGAVRWEYLLEVRHEGYWDYRARLAPSASQFVKAEMAPE